MGNALCMLLGQPGGSATAGAVKADAASRVERLGVPVLRKRSRDARHGSTLQDACVVAVAQALAAHAERAAAAAAAAAARRERCGQPKAAVEPADSDACCGGAALAVEDLPLELQQRVLDQLISMDKLTLPLLRRLASPWLHRLALAGVPRVGDSWMGAVACCAARLMELDLSGAARLTDAGAAALPRLTCLRALRLQHCAALTDDGIAHLASLHASLAELDLEGCEGLGDAGLQRGVGRLTGLTQLGLAQCGGVTTGGLRHLSGLVRLRQLSLGWCRGVASSSGSRASSSSSGNSDGADGGGGGGIAAALSRLTNLTQLCLAGTRAGDRQLSALLPQLRSLAVLDLSGTGAGPRGLAAALPPLAPTLRALKLRGCHVGDGAAPAALGRLSGLESLDLSCSGLGSGGLLQLAPLVRLSELVLDMTRVGDEGCRALPALRALARLDLSDTDVGDAGAGCLARCRSLEWLSLCNTEVGDGAAASLTQLTRLTHLNLDARHCTDACLRLLSPGLGATLLELDLHGVRVTARGAALLASGFPALRRVDLCGGHVTDRACAELARMTALRALNLSQNRAVGDAGVRALALGLGGGGDAGGGGGGGGSGVVTKDSGSSSTSSSGEKVGAATAAAAPPPPPPAAPEGLAVLHLGHTGATDACVPALASMAALRVVVLTGSHVSEAAAARLRRARPELTVKGGGGGARLLQGGGRGGGGR